MTTRLGDLEILEFGHGRLTTTSEPANLGPVDVGPAAQEHGSPPPPPNSLSRQRPTWLALALMFVLGLTAGAATSYGRDSGSGDAAADAPVALTAGAVSLDDEVVPLSSTAGVAPVSVRLHNSGRHDVEVLSVNLVAWQHGEGGSVRPAVTVPAGQSRTVGAGISLDCERPRPPTASVVQVRLRTDALGVVRMTRPLSEPGRALSQAWKDFCG